MDEVFVLVLQLKDLTVRGYLTTIIRVRVVVVVEGIAMNAIKLLELLMVLVVTTITCSNLICLGFLLLWIACLRFVTTFSGCCHLYIIAFISYDFRLVRLLCWST